VTASKADLHQAGGEVTFLDEGIARQGRRAVVLECLRDPHSVVGEELRLLKARLQGLCRTRGLKVVAVGSALPGEGKSTISVGLASALAREAGQRVLLIEADLRRPTISETLGLPPAPGLSEWLNAALDQLPVRRIGAGGFSLLVAGQAALESPESVGGPLMAAALRAARHNFDFVVVDSPPVLPVADTVLLQDLLDGFLLVVRSRLTPREAVVDALGRLRRDKVLGFVLNDHREYRHSYTNYAYERYGMAYGPRSPGSRGGRR
jgi:protein-tyrosine kinase